ncbi:MAG TPA: hypothetical protein VIM19_02970 [Actinomycetes bacterium]
MNRLLALLAAAVLLAACSGGSTGRGSASSTAASPTTSVSGSEAPPTAEQVARAGQVCTATSELMSSIQSLVSAAIAGGTDVKSSLSTQLETIKRSVTELVGTVAAVPVGSADDPDLTAVQRSADRLRSSVDALETAVAAVQGTSGAATVASFTALVETTQAIGTAARDGTGALGRAFAANPSCASLTS